MSAYKTFLSKESELCPKTVLFLVYKLSEISEEKILIRAEFCKTCLLIVLAVHYY
jgi:hypothetical protein